MSLLNPRTHLKLWKVSTIMRLTEDKWELCNTDEDFSLANDLAAKNLVDAGRGR